MATMVKEKHKEKKKKPKGKQISATSALEESVLNLNSNVEDIRLCHEIKCAVSTSDAEDVVQNISETNSLLVTTEASGTESKDQHTISQIAVEEQGVLSIIPDTSDKLDVVNKISQSEMAPSAPLMLVEPENFLENKEQESSQQEPNAQENPRNLRQVSIMSLEDVEQLFGGVEIAEVRLLSEKEENNAVEAGVVVTPDHPLIDLLTTFRRSLIAVDRERIEIARGYAEEDNFRGSLWKIEKREACASKFCLCGETVKLVAKYEHATFFKNKVPADRMKLEILLKNVQESYCHHQHEALLTYWQIEELIHSITQSTNTHVREALSLVLDALRTSDTLPALSVALQRWARALTVRLLRDGDLANYLFLLHHLFRQTRSVRWASRLVHLSTSDMSEAARMVTLLDILLSTPRTTPPEPALECTEDSEDVWEEVDKYGSAGAVSDGAMRERDILALLYRMPLRSLLARLAFILRQDIENMSEYEWGDGSGGHGVLKCAYGVRYLLAVLLRGTRNHFRYKRLTRALAKIALNAIHGLADLDAHCRLQYALHLMPTIEAEIEACMLLGWTLLSITKMRLHRLPFSAFTAQKAKIMCQLLSEKLHEPLNLPVEGQCNLDCSSRVRIVAQMAIDRIYDYELAGFVITFLIPLALSRKSPSCKDLCEGTARSMLPRLLAAHPQLYQSAFHIFADLYTADNTAVSYIECVSPSGWRPSAQEAVNVLNELSERCPTLLPHVLLTLDCTPFSGLSLDTQLGIGEWLCRYARDSSDKPEWTWKVLRRLRLHRTWWKSCLEVPPPREEPKDLLSSAHALLATGWGHTIPLVCEYAVTVLAQLVDAGRSRDAVHCLGRIMLVMTQSPESIAYTPKFSAFRSNLLETGPSLVQRALGLGGIPGAVILSRLVTQQLTCTYKELEHRTPRSLLYAWLQFLAPVTALSPSATPLLEVALVCCRRYPDALQAFDEHFCHLLQDENARGQLKNMLRNATVAPSVAEAALRAEHGERELRSALWPRLLDAVYNQKRASRNIHIGNAIKSIVQYRYSSDDLVIYKLATALLATPVHHPAYISLWSQFLQLYLQRPPSFMRENIPSIGPLFFSGIIKSRVLGQLKKRMLQTINYHLLQSESLKQQTKSTNTKNTTLTPTRPAPEVKCDVNDLLPPLTIDNLIGESEFERSSSSEQSDSDEEVSSRSKSLTPSDDTVSADATAHLIDYHDGAQKALRDYLRWLEEDEKTRAMPHHVDLTRFIPQKALDAVWNLELERYTSMLSSSDDDGQSSQKSRLERRDSKTPFQRVVTRLCRLRLAADRSEATPQLAAPLGGAYIKNASDLLRLVDQFLKEIALLSTEWATEVNRVSTQDGALWRFVEALHVRRVFSPVTLYCSKKCSPIHIVLPGAEWYKSLDAERGVAENRASARAALRRLARARPHAARAVATLYSLARAVREPATAVTALEYAWHYASAPHLQHCPAAKEAIIGFVTALAEKWICNDSERCAYLISRWCNQQLNSLQLCLTGSLIEPRLLPSSGLSVIYRAVLRSNIPPHSIFSRLSKFEVKRWATSAGAEQRREVINAIVETALGFGPEAPKEYSMLIELLDVHLYALVTAYDLPAHALRCTRSVAEGKWPIALWKHVLRAAEQHCHTMSGDTICGMLREMGALWWEIRTKGQANSTLQVQYTKHVPFIVGLYKMCARAVVTAMLSAHTTSELAAWYAWSSTSEAWGAWLLPHLASPLLQTTEDQVEQGFMLREFVDTLNEVIKTCPGGEVRLFQEAWLWTCSACIAVSNRHQAEDRAQLLSLCAELLRLPWNEHGWFHARCINVTLQLCTLSDEDKIWASDVLKSVDATGWLAGVADLNIAPHLAAVLYITTALPSHEKTLQEVMRLPWWRLPLSALEVELHRFFFEKHQHEPYHTVPSFRVLLSASEMYTSTSVNGCGREKRLSFISYWVRACAEPQIPASYLNDAAASMLNICNAVYGTDTEIENRTGHVFEAEEFLCRAVALLGSEPGSSVAVPAWVQWCRDASPQLIEAALSAAATLTAREPFGSIAEALLQAHLTTMTGSWSLVCQRWSSCGWHEAAWLGARGRLLSAYGVMLAIPHMAEQLQQTFLALAQIKLDFNEYEPAAALWICRAARAIWEENGILDSRSGERNVTGSGMTRNLVTAAAEALIAAWVEPPPVMVSLMRAFALNSTEDRPTAKLRALCRYAQCVLAGGMEETARAFESACSSALGSKAIDTLPWVKNTYPRMLPALAQTFYTKHRRYFDKELELAPGNDMTTPSMIE